MRPFLLIAVFLIALQSLFTFWSEVGGQYHLDLMFWPWKFGLSLAAAGLVTAVAREALVRERFLTRRSVLALTLLIAVVIAAGLVTFYYHQNEPADEDEQDDNGTTYTTLLTTPGTSSFRAPSADSAYS